MATIKDESERTATVVCGQRAYAVPADVAAELAELRKDAERYRRLGWLVKSGEWGVVHEDTDEKQYWMCDKEHMDEILDSAEVVESSEQWMRCFVKANQGADK